MINFDSIEEWKAYCFNTHKSYLKNGYFRRWIEEKKVDVFDCSLLKKNDTRLITKTIGNVLNLCGRNFKIRLNKGLNLDFAIRNNQINGAKILSMVKNSRNDKCSASIFLVNKKAKSGKNVLKFGDALTFVSDGVTIFAFNPSVKYPSRFFKAAIAHEMYHLLGLNVHHEDTEVSGYPKLKCVMEYNAPTEFLCQKCKDGLISFWKGVEYATKQQFIKT